MNTELEQEIILGQDARKGTPLYKPYKYVPPRPPRVGFLGRFGLKKGIDFAHWVSRELGECMNVFIFSFPNE